MPRASWLPASDGRIPVIGMLHAPPLPGSPAFSEPFESAVEFVLRDADALVAAGIPALMLENFGDAPFFPRRVPPETVAALTRLAAEVRRRFDVPLGINVLRNDGRAALAIAVATGASFIRINVLTGARLTDQGIVEGIAHNLLRDRAKLRAESIRILADVDVKHSAPLAPRPLSEETQDTLERGGADAVIVSGRSTGDAVDLATLHEVKAAAKVHPVLIGSGITVENIATFARVADGLVVGTSLKREGIVSNPVDSEKARDLMAALPA